MIDLDWNVLDVRFYPHSGKWEAFVLRQGFWYKAVAMDPNTAVELVRTNIRAGRPLKRLAKALAFTANIPQLDLELDL